ncbi:MAG: metal-dependent hydrolase [bacterium]|nr:metal-dependent hydrolase [bacterium]
MTPFAHGASGYWVYKVVADTPSGGSPLLFALCIAGALVPDVDGLFGKQMKDHRNTIFHAPSFWVFLFVVIRMFVFLVGNESIALYANAFFSGVFIHIFLDWFSGRTSGIRIFYPFSRKIYALFPIHPERGNIPVLPNKDHLIFWKFYLENKFLVLTELLVILSPLVFLIKG